MNKEQIALEIIYNMDIGAYFVDTNRKIQSWNKAAEKITGYTEQEMIGKSCKNSNLNHIDEKARPLCDLLCPLYQSNIDGEKRTAEVFVRRKDGTRVRIKINVVPVRNENSEIIGSMELFYKEAELDYDDSFISELSEEIYKDELTNLMNRRALLESLRFRLFDYKNMNVDFAVFFLDIDNFKELNDNYGHNAGDVVLIELGRILREYFSGDDAAGRWGGEEFLGIFFPKDREAMEEKIENLRLLIEKATIPYKDKVLNITVSIGATFVSREDDIDSIVKRADECMYRSKKQGRNCVTVG